MSIKYLQDLFPPHRVTIQSIRVGLCAPTPSKALEYIMNKFDKIDIVINKHKVGSLTMTIKCGHDMYNLIKLQFVKDMGADFLWKD